MSGITRRLFLGLAAESARRLLAGEAASASRAYRVDATILFLSIPLFTRRNVGAGYARHLVKPDTGEHVLEFAAGSLPERARGLNRLGLIRERVTAGGAEAHYFGFMTSAREESLGEAKKTLYKSPGASLFVAIEGENRRSAARCRRAQFTSGEPAGAMRWSHLEGKAESALKDSGWTVESSSAQTFLYALLQAVQSPAERLRQEYVYGRDRFELVTARKRDAAAGRRLQAKGLAVQPAKVVMLSGSIRNLRTGWRTTFRIWTEQDGNPVPLRIEYRPRGFLVLALETDPNQHF